MLVVVVMELYPLRPGANPNVNGKKVQGNRQEMGPKAMTGSRMFYARMHPCGDLN